MEGMVNFVDKFNVSQALRSAFAEALGNIGIDDTHSKLKIFQRSKNIKDGDFAIPLNFLKGYAKIKFPSLEPDRTESALDKLDNETDGLHRLEQITEQVVTTSQLWTIPLTSCKFNQSDFCLYVKLNRKTAIQKVIEQILPKNEIHMKEKDGKTLSQSHSSEMKNDLKNLSISEGSHRHAGKRLLVLNNVEEFYHSTSDELPLGFLRVALVKKHLCHIFTANGFEVNNVQYSSSEKTRQLYDYCGVGNSDTSRTFPSQICQAAAEELRFSQYNKSKNAGGSKVAVLDLKSFLSDYGCCQENGGYDHNIDQCHVTLSEEDEKLILVSRLEDLLQQLSPKACQLNCVCIHLVSQPHQFCMQQVDLLWQMTSERSRGIQHFICVLGPVQSRKGIDGSAGVTTANGLLSLREDQMREVSVMKYGEKVRGKQWDSTTKSMALASLTFELVTTVLRNPVKLDVSTTTDLSQSNKGGSFVMYNYARLSTMFQHFGESVEQGIYPPLPDMEAIDFANLKDEMEWFLLFTYVYSYPHLVNELMGDITESKSLHAKIPTHKMCTFLSNLSQDLSSYYSRVHILCEPRPHLFPVMFARLYLMKCIQHVIKQGLDLLGLNTLEQV